MIKEEGLHAVGRPLPRTIPALELTTLTVLLRFHIYIFLFSYKPLSLLLIKYSQLVPLNIHRTALLRLSAPCQWAYQQAQRNAAKSREKPKN